MSKSGRVNSNRGSVLLELTVALPIFICGIMIVMLTSSLSQARAVLTSAVGNSVRLAATRSESGLFGGEQPPITKIENYISSDGNIDDVLSYLTYRVNFDDAHETYDEWINESFSVPGGESCDLEKLLTIGCHGTGEKGKDRRYVYALVYALQEIRQGVGPSVRFPCDPNKSAELGGGVGCVKCTFIPEIDMINLKYSGTTFGIRCEMGPDFGLVTPVVRLINIWSGTSVSSGSAPIILSRHKIIDPDYQKVVGFVRG